MKSNTLITLLAIAVLATSGAVGCRKKPSRLTNIPGKTSPIGEETPGGPKLGDAGTVGGMGPTGSGVTGVPDQGFPPAGGDFSKYTERRERFATETVFFDFDKSNIKASELPKIRAVADAMKSTPATRSRWRAIATSAAPRNTTVRWASGEPCPCANNWFSSV